MAGETEREYHGTPSLFFFLKLSKSGRPAPLSLVSLQPTSVGLQQAAAVSRAIVLMAVMGLGCCGGWKGHSWRLVDGEQESWLASALRNEACFNIFHNSQICP